MNVYLGSRTTKLITFIILLSPIPPDWLVCQFVSKQKLISILYKLTYVEFTINVRNVQGLLGTVPVRLFLNGDYPCTGRTSVQFRSPQ